MLNASARRGTIVQYGSGKPGEDGSAEFERSLFLELDLRDPRVVFIPFHALAEGDNDWTRFLAIYGPLTSGAIELCQLVPFERQPHPGRLERQLASAEVIVLGSGLVEPYMEAILASGLDRTLSELHGRGTVFFGYSAGTLALGSEFRWLLTGEELLDVLEDLLAGPLKEAPLEAAVEAFCSVFQAAPAPDALLRIVRRSRAEGPQSIAGDPFLAGFQAMSQAPGLGFVPGAVHPHFGELGQCTLPLLEKLHALHPETLHLGVPNGTAAVTVFGPEGPRMRARGTHPRHRVTWIDPQGVPHPCADQDEIPLRTATRASLHRPAAGIA